MSETIWIHCARPRPHWYEKSEDERTRLRRRWGDIGVESERDGARSLGPYHVRGQHDFETVEIWVFASAQRAFDHWARLTAAGYSEWFAFANTIGLKAEAPA